MGKNRITLYLRYTIDPNKLTDFAGPTNEGFGLIDFTSLAEYEIYRAKLAAHPLHKKNAALLESTGALLSIQRSLIERVESAETPEFYPPVAESVEEVV
jgi:hypothetical protein